MAKLWDYCGKAEDKKLTHLVKTDEGSHYSNVHTHTHTQSNMVRVALLENNKKTTTTSHHDRD